MVPNASGVWGDRIRRCREHRLVQIRNSGRRQGMPASARNRKGDSHDMDI